ncbi:probable indole-3-pyruvate monooxygenase YUCCA11 isoform X2 [Henckelia pumila]|uniref:probable indole-3-pyruvate monooxygenase YUCCA11 isoform X2 n=1 Tax=Henckelia pumila TaxID=405737 RepID=UPI003C6DBD59
MIKQEILVLIIGAGPAGLATSACLNLKNIPNIVLEKEDCCASLWKKRAYDRLKLHLAKQYCQLPGMPFPPDAPTFMPKRGFIRYLDDYVSHHNVAPLYNRQVECASFDDGKWTVVARNMVLDRYEEYVAAFLVVASGENGEAFVPQIPGLDSFSGDVMHSSDYRNGKKYENRNVLVVGSGNSGMEIAFDLWDWGAQASIVARSPVHILTERMVQMGMALLKYVPLGIVDKILIMLSKLKFGDLCDYGIQRPDKGPFYLKMTTGRSPVIDVGTIDKIRSQEIKYIKSVDGHNVHFTDGSTETFDSIVFATGYKTTVAKWLKDDGALFSANGMPEKRAPEHWKGKNGLYCAGFSRSGLFGISNDARAIAQDINELILSHEM